MGVLAKKRVLFVLMLLSCFHNSLEARAADYGLSAIDFFGLKTQMAGSCIDQDSSADWREYRLGSGNISSVRPPLAVLALLENPTEENGRKYLNWNKRRMEKLFKAQQIIDRLDREGYE